METERNLYLFLTANKSCAKQLFATQAALQRLKELVKSEQANFASLTPRFRIRVDSGGCFGFQYHFTFDTVENSDDVIFLAPEFEVIIDEVSLGLLDGVILDYLEDLMGASFQLRNPNAVSSCGCGNSFAI